MLQENITVSEEFDIRYFLEDDLEPLKELLLQDFVMEQLPFSQISDVDLFLKNWKNFIPYKCSLTALYKGEVIGYAALFLLPYLKVAIHTMGYVVVKEKFQNKGVGTSLVRNLAHLSKNFRIVENISFELYEGCRLIPILNRLGFEKVFEQEGFVKNIDVETGKVKYKSRIVFERSNKTPM